MQTKMKSLLPSLKEKKRYLVFEMIPIESVLNPTNKTQISGYGTLNAVTTKIKMYLGIFDSADAGIIPIEFDNRTGRGILKINNQYVDKVKAIMMFIDEIESQPIIMKSVGISGMINKAKTKFKAA